MPVKTEYRKNGVILWHEDIVTGEQLIAVNKEIYSHEFQEDFQFQLLVLTDVTEFNVSSRDMKTLADMDTKAERDCKQYACVVARDDFLFGMSRMWNIQADEENFESRVVREIDEALSWLNSKGIEVKI